MEVAHRHAVSLKIMILPDARSGHRSASEAIIQEARDLHLAQPMVTGRITGFRRLVARLLGIDDVKPVVVEIIDAQDRLEVLARKVHQILPDAMISWESVELWVPLEVIE
jgi:PII-like signaling protein